MRGVGAEHTQPLKTNQKSIFELFLLLLKGVIIPYHPTEGMSSLKSTEILNNYMSEDLAKIIIRQVIVIAKSMN